MYFNTHTYYSLRYGTLSPEQLVGLAKKHNIQQLALTDINNCTAIPEFVQRCQASKIHPIAGMEFRQGSQLLYIVIARNNEGFRRINEFLSYHNASGTALPDRFPACGHTFVIYPFCHTRPWQAKDHEFTGVRPRDLHRLASSPLKQHPEKLLAWLPVSFADQSDYNLHFHLRAIHHNLLLSHLRKEQVGDPGEVMQPEKNIWDLYKDFPQLIGNTLRMLEQCSINFDFHTPKNRKTFTGQASGDRELLEKLATEGLCRRYGKNNKEAMLRMHHELEIIHKLGFSAYFLITWDIVRYSLSQGFHHVGRGSGANSIVAYCLQITDVDPIELDLYFERFINPKRTSPPDFDIDYCWKDRDRVLDYIFKRYGRSHTALLGTISTFRYRSSIRELGKVHGLPKHEIDLLAGGEAAHTPPDKLSAGILDMAARLRGYPNLRSIHAGGVLVSEQPIACYSALDMPPKGMPTVQWDMHTSEELGFEKIDILSQRGIGHINDCIRIIRENHGKHIDIHQVDQIKEDEGAKGLLLSGETTGCFYVESPAMRGLLKKLRCNHYTGLVAASSIIRPGVSSSGMMQEYIRRFHLPPDQITYLHPVMENLLRETFGVMVYQEDVIKVCHHFAGLDLADADILRRAMSGKYRSATGMQRLKQRFFDRCKGKGHPEHLSREVWRQIESFAAYSFSKAHSASFAVESFQSLYLKAHYPLEFMTAVINNFGGFYRSEVYFNEARRFGARIEPPCINKSMPLTRIGGDTIYMGFVHIQGLNDKVQETICRERNLNGNYTSLEDFISRTGTSLKQIIILIRAGSFRFTGISKNKLLWSAHLLAGPMDQHAPSLFVSPVKTYDLPEGESSLLSHAYDEMELLGFCVSVSPFDLLQTSFRGEVRSADMRQKTGKTLRMVGWYVAVKYTKTVSGSLMCFGCFVDDRGHFFDTVHFPESCKKYPFRGHGIYLLKGQVTEEFGHPSLTVEKMARLPLKGDPRHADANRLKPVPSGRRDSLASQDLPHP